MEVHPSQLTPECVLVSDVFGKTKRPIVLKNTIISEMHIQVLQQFLIDKVEVAPKLANGAPFYPKERKATNDKIKKIEVQPLIEHYNKTVHAYKKMFWHWQSGSYVQIQKVRQLIVPLLERIEEFGLSILELYLYSNKQDYFYHHSVATSLLAALLAKRLGIKKEWMQVGIAAFLAESGMAKINRSIFLKKGLLNEAEFKEIKKHPIYSYRYIEKSSALSKGAKLAILQHHERLDGTGYPLGVKSDKIHSFAKIIAVCDTYHAMTSERNYRKSQSPFNVIEQMERDCYQKFNYRIFNKFIDLFASYPLGTKVQLSNGSIGEIVYKEPKFPTRPIVRLENGEMIILKENKSLYIEQILH
ncbi:Cyclic di-GMP phosphodiesterase response regulator RpfG [Paraliobacillus sp. PM-2]|uniref:HD-GYP domain-containing protein n=1 Tax=Paraliobacillus sp. PM-2 TaxID=1462524 RepID=UPI00061CB12F|nr:HD-GYP domain-containing protein [Paraliobacillus sp. PM-2]CQR45791.1 Cyclic di-GMP phosphodiesterase response regulator RpfG [Paraliobacillus sp. PM-2]